MRKIINYEDIFDKKNKLKAIIVDDDGKAEHLFLDDYTNHESILFPGDKPTHHPDILLIYLKIFHNYETKARKFSDICMEFNKLSNMILFDSNDFLENSKYNRLGLLAIPNNFTESHQEFLLKNEEYFKFFYDNILLYFIDTINHEMGENFDQLIDYIKEKQKNNTI